MLTALGLGLAADTFTRLTVDGWHHMWVLHFPAASGGIARGIGAHTGYGLLVIAAQDGDRWTFVTPEPHVFTVFPGDILRFLTGGRITTRRILQEDRLTVLAKLRELNRTMSPCMR